MEDLIGDILDTMQDFFIKGDALMDVAKIYMFLSSLVLLIVFILLIAVIRNQARQRRDYKALSEVLLNLQEVQKQNECVGNECNKRD